MRAARVLRALWEDADENRDDEPWCHTRLLELIVRDEYTVVGQSLAAAEAPRRRREHVVPLRYLADLVFNAFKNGHSLSDVASLLDRLLKIVRVTYDEARLIDAMHGKASMPDGWLVESGDPFVRLSGAGIQFRKTPG
ncbi:hypothetical protein [Pandoraea sp.]|uniref:hypothetical protein n=1 Tax=Pandoraea sp. TaxID=1883445 RepID=UPI001218630C|nr:hypothetical protein [Pandoraea sp.]TAL55299.1 MAG: hypothetical protein EPN80_08105 [Pandoraea sp.]TAM18217.1 MAG: hypothetical protein EPN65_07975 [Pandoraea sp.]